MRILTFLENSYYKACELRHEKYEVKSAELYQLCKDIKLQSQNEIGSRALKELLNELFKVGTIINDIKWSDKSQEEKEELLEQCRFMIEIQLGQIIVLELQCSKKQ